MAIGDIVKNVINEVLADILKKATGAKRRKRRVRAKTPTERLRQIEKLLKPAERDPARTADGRFGKRRATPAKRQTSARKTVRSRAKTRRR